jgi:hypothetical protein
VAALFVDITRPRIVSRAVVVVAAVTRRRQPRMMAHPRDRDPLRDRHGASHPLLIPRNTNPHRIGQRPDRDHHMTIFDPWRAGGVGNTHVQFREVRTEKRTTRDSSTALRSLPGAAPGDQTIVGIFPDDQPVIRTVLGIFSKWSRDAESVEQGGRPEAQAELGVCPCSASANPALVWIL